MLQTLKFHRIKISKIKIQWSIMQLRIHSQISKHFAKGDDIPLKFLSPVKGLSTYFFYKRNLNS